MSNFQVSRLSESDALTSVSRINELLSELTKTGRATSSRDIIETLKLCHILVVREIPSLIIIGMGTVSQMKQLGRSYCVIDDVVVSSAYRGRGVFKILMDELEEEAARFGVARIELHTSRELAAALYRKRGYHLHDGAIYRKGL